MIDLARRNLIAGIAAAGALALLGCDQPTRQAGPGKLSLDQGSASASQPTQRGAMTVFRDPSCGCCEAWAKIAKSAGYKVTLVDRSDMPAIKQKYGVPEAFQSCHTAIVGGYVLEGHVPMEDVARLLKERPSEIKGIAVAGMPRGSPGMEMPDGSKDPFQVMAFDAAGRTFLFRG